MNKALIWPILFIKVILFISSPLGSASTSTLKIINALDEQHIFQIEVATTAKEQQKGLMYRSELKNNHGMLFIYPSTKIIYMWMKNTLIPLDMIFIKKDGTIASITEHTTPLSTESISSYTPCIGVLEINAGLSQQLSIKPGDKVYYQPPSLEKNN